MARGIHTRKRSLPQTGRAMKRRKFVRRRRSGMRKGFSMTNRNSAATSVGTFRTRKTSLRTYRNRLWNDTLFKQHFRSILDTTGNISTPNNTNQATVILINGLGTFYTVAGGAVSADSGVLVPSFQGDVILRGGICRLSVSNRAPEGAPSIDNVRVTVYACWTTANPTITFASVVPTMWDPSVAVEFEKFGKVLWKKEVILKSDGESVQFYHKFKVQKIDQQIFQNNPRGQSLVWMLMVSQMSNQETAPTAETLDYMTSHNVSFSADAN